MSIGRGARGRARAVVGGAAFAALLGATLVAPADAAPVQAPECPGTLSSAAATTGLVGEGWTVVKGNTPEPFKVEVLGVQPDGIGAGHDLVMIKVSDLPGRHVIDQGAGIWAGMSGSPVYVDGKLLGAVSYGFTDAPSPIGGLTPASDMAALLSLGSPAARAREAAEPAAKKTITLSSATRRQVAASTRTALPSSTIDRLPSPFAVSGLSSVRRKRLQKDVQSAGLPLRVYAAGRVAAPKAAPAARPVAGGNFASLQSYGDVTAGSIGTTTYVCGDRALAYGHPDEQAGPVSYGANGADALAIVQDDTFGSFKMANIGDSFGTVDQDRLAGLRADLTKTPATTPITTHVLNHDTGRSRDGSTRVTDADLLPALTPYAVWANADATFDEIGDGRLSETWTITGTRAGGKAFTVRRGNKWADRDDVTLEPAISLADAVYSLTENEDEPVVITSVDEDMVVATAFRQVHLSKIRVSKDNGKTWHKPTVVQVKAGTKLLVETTVKPYQGTKATTKVTRLTVPKSAKGQALALAVEAGTDLAQGSDEPSSDDSACLLDGSCDTDEAATLDTVIKGLQSAPRNDDLVVSLQTDDEGSDDQGDEGSAEGPSVLASSRVRQPEVVTGSKVVPVVVR